MKSIVRPFGHAEDFEDGPSNPENGIQEFGRTILDASISPNSAPATRSRRAFKTIGQASEESLARFLRQEISFIENTKEIEPRFPIFDAKKFKFKHNMMEKFHCFIFSRVAQ
jgi:hypothetical protein